MAHINVNDLKVATDAAELKTIKMKWQPTWFEPFYLTKVYMNKYMQFPKMQRLSQEHFASWLPTSSDRAATSSQPWTPTERSLAPCPEEQELQSTGVGSGPRSGMSLLRDPLCEEGQCTRTP